MTAGTDRTEILFRDKKHREYYLLVILPMFFISTDMLPSAFVINSTEFLFWYSSIGILISIPVSVVRYCFSNFLVVFVEYLFRYGRDIDGSLFRQFLA
mgnify:CR=1 FL=1